uniref:Uncharacterized protein n=1 Tax=Panagrellus redivivus TaxID=6233 RepID=A0A7E4V028_PANRE
MFSHLYLLQKAGNENLDLPKHHTLPFVHGFSNNNLLLPFNFIMNAFSSTVFSLFYFFAVLAMLTEAYPYPQYGGNYGMGSGLLVSGNPVYSPSTWDQSIVAHAFWG